MIRHAAAVYRNADSAREVCHQLIREGIAPSRIDVLPASRARGLMPIVRSSLPEGLALGALLGGAAGAATALSVLFVPALSLGLEPGVGSLAAGALAGGSVGALAGALAGLFRAEPQKRRYAELLMKRGVVVSVDTADPGELKTINAVYVAARGVLLRALEAPVDGSTLHEAPGR